MRWFIRRRAPRRTRKVRESPLVDVDARPRFRPRLEALEVRAAASVLYGLADSNVLIQFDSDSPGSIDHVAIVSGLEPGETIKGIDFRPATGQLYGVGLTGGDTGRLYTIDPLTGAAEAVGDTPFSTTLTGLHFGLDFNPVADRLRLVTDTDLNLRINPNTGGLVMADDPLTYTAPATGPVVGSAYDRNFDGATLTTLFGIDSGANRLVMQGGVDGTPSPNDGDITSVGALGVDVRASAGFDIVAGAGTALAALTDDSTGLAGLYGVNLATGAATLAGTIGNGALVIEGLAAVPESRIVTGTDVGSPPTVKVFDAFTNEELMSFDAYNSGFTGGVRVATGDVNRDGTPDIITGAGPGGGPNIRVFDGTTGDQFSGLVGDRFAYAADFRGGIFVASGDVNGDGFDDIITGADAGGGPHVKVFDGTDGDELLSFFAFASDFQGGVRVAAADFDMDGDAEIVAGAGPGGGPNVRVFDGAAAMIEDEFVYDAGFSGGVYVAAGDIDGNGFPDLITGAGQGGGPHVKAFNADGDELADFLAYNSIFLGGVRVAVADANADGRFEIITGPGVTGQSHIRAFEGVTQPGGIPQQEVDFFYAYDLSDFNGFFVGGGRF